MPKSTKQTKPIKNTEITESTKLNHITEMKTKMLEAIWGMIMNKGLKQKEAALFLDISQPRVSNIKKGKTDNFSIDKCIELLKKLGHELIFDYKITMVDTKCKVIVNKTNT